MDTTVGIVGLGNAGSAMATALSGKMPLVGFDVDPKRRQAVAHLALECVPSLATWRVAPGSSCCRCRIPTSPSGP